jgi:hypothetical protein
MEFLCDGSRPSLNVFFKYDGPTRERDKARATLGSELGLDLVEKEEGARVEGYRLGRFFFFLSFFFLSSNSRALNCSNNFG